MEIKPSAGLLPELPKGWDDPQSPLHFRIPPDERAFLKLKLRQLARPNDEASSLLARLVAAEDLFEDASLGLPKELDARADVPGLFRLMDRHYGESTHTISSGGWSCRSASTLRADPD